MKQIDSQEPFLIPCVPMITFPPAPKKDYSMASLNQGIPKIRDTKHIGGQKLCTKTRRDCQNLHMKHCFSQSLWTPTIMHNHSCLLPWSSRLLSISLEKLKTGPAEIDTETSTNEITAPVVCESQLLLLCADQLLDFQEFYSHLKSNW